MNTLRVLVQDIQQLGSGAARASQAVLPFGQGRKADAEHLRQRFLGHAVQLPEVSDFAAPVVCPGTAEVEPFLSHSANKNVLRDG